jgi:DNA-binding transcriptional LysR family regulator
MGSLGYDESMAAPLDLTHLTSFVAIADAGGFGRAAATLHVSQSTVSQHVRLLEKRLGGSLVEREGRATRFTPAGERLLAEARRLLAAHDEALGRLDAITGTALIIGSTETAAEQVLPNLLTNLRDEFPERRVQFHIDRSTRMIEAVDKGLVDVGVLLGFAGDTPGQRVGELELGWYAAVDWAHAATTPWPLVAYQEPCGMRQRALARLSEAGEDVEVVAESTSIEGVLAGVRAGLGVAVLPTSGGEPRGLTRRTDLPALGTIGVYLAARKGVDLDVERRVRSRLDAFFSDEGARVQPSANAMDRHGESSPFTA